MNLPLILMKTTSQEFALLASMSLYTSQSVLLENA